MNICDIKFEYETIHLHAHVFVHMYVTIMSDIANIPYVNLQKWILAKIKINRNDL